METQLNADVEISVQLTGDVHARVGVLVVDSYALVTEWSDQRKIAIAII